MRRLPLLLLASLIAALARPAIADAPALARVDYTDPATWLCLPGRTDACSQELTATVIRAGGVTEKRTYSADPKAPVDCFYVYPTVSRESTANSDMTAGPDEKRVVVNQFARFGTACRLYAPLYRQITVTALRNNLRKGTDDSGDFEQPYRDVLNAWNTYLAKYNNGRGVVLVGHSQGSFMLTRLIASEIDGKPEQQRLISAILIGGRVETPAGRDVGGSFQHVPLCRKAAQTGCLIAYSSYLAAEPPGADASFGGARPGNVDACVDPAALEGHKFLDAELPPLGLLTRSFGTTLIETPGQLTAACTTTADHTYLGISTGTKSEVLTHMLHDVQAALPGWGLHVLDVNLTLGNLVDLVGTESQAWLAHH